jgi:hypothetical protein
MHCFQELPGSGRHSSKFFFQQRGVDKGEPMQTKKTTVASLEGGICDR